MEVRPNPTVENLRATAAASSKQPVSSPNTVDTTSVTQRLQKELMSLMMSGGDLGVSAFPEGESIFTWIGTIEGGKGTMYEGLSYKLSLRFPLDYPFKPPQVKFETMCFHPNVDQYGNICLDILQDKWSSAYDCRTILLSIQSLLGEPNPESPLNSYAAALLNNKEGDLFRLESGGICDLVVVLKNLLFFLVLQITEKWSRNSTLLENLRANLNSKTDTKSDVRLPHYFSVKLKGKGLFQFGTCFNEN
ncbi:UBC core domain-containing protein [Citrus sinensis]|uniref:E2 ubiquitin-conjugating enzyme n=1 Tax=Citrus unshiu TaxID=55188 RepID=A0A2H5PB24_CITUN|nr:UBC core domain-containing protein [Citrus sinensis]GAY49572.1 hypothetical protein CUMW_120150 [Citrus unshiu]